MMGIEIKFLYMINERVHMNRTANYTAFYVKEPFSPTNLGANATEDFCYYNMLKAWKGKDSSFPFIDAHEKTYSVRDNSDWELTLKPRLHERLLVSKNMILFLSSHTTYSRALNEEIDYGINTLGLPVIVIYPEYDTRSDIVDGNGYFQRKIKELWNNLPKFRDSMSKVPTIHVCLNQYDIRGALDDNNFKIQTKGECSRFYYKPKQ